MSRSVIGMVEPRKMGAVSGIFNMFRNLGGPFGTAIAATLFGNRVVMQGMTSAMADVARFLLVVCALMLLVALILPNLRPRSRGPRSMLGQSPD